MNPLLTSATLRKQLFWTSFCWYADGSKPDSFKSGNKYLCCDLHGNMAVCTWSVTDWVIYVDDFTTNSIRESLEKDAAYLLARSLCDHKFTRKDFEEVAYEVKENLYEGTEQSSVYFDEVEWYMELPNPPTQYVEDLPEGSDISAAVFDQSTDLMAHVEAAIKSYVVNAINKTEDKK